MTMGKVESLFFFCPQSGTGRGKRQQTFTYFTYLEQTEVLKFQEYPHSLLIKL